ncbi:transglutaminaseTgpA domain-containing protein [Burkholderiaceae bacterium UC74_6]
MRALTRETRDTFFLLATIAAVVLPHGSRLPLWVQGFCALMLGWRAMLAWRGLHLPGRWLLALVTVAAGAGVLLTYRSLLNREAGIAFLSLLMALKTLELRARRDAFVVFFLGFFLVLTQFLYSQSLPTALWMLLVVWALLTALVLAQMPVGQPSLALAARQALRVTAYGLPAMVLLYLLFPRIAPLWGIPAETVGRTGLSNQMAFGAMSEIANDESIALRLRFTGAVPPPGSRYLRGPVLEVFDGIRWTARTGVRRGDEVQPLGTPWRYEMTVEPLRIRVLPLLESAGAGLTLQAGPYLMQRGAEQQWISPVPITERLRFNAQAWPSQRAGMDRSLNSLSVDLTLPNGLNPRTLAWARALRAEPRFAALDDGARPQALADALMEHIKTGDYIYTLSPGRYGETTPHVIDEFWFDRRLGFCEHFAAAFVVIMRAAGVPARVVTGFQGFDAEPQDDWWIVRNSNAHAWAEYWAPGRGWQRADPTAAIAPDRVQQGLALRPAPGALERFSPQIWPQVRGLWERIDNRWQQLILNYSRQDQFDLLKSMGFSQPDWLALGRLGAGVIAVIALGAAGLNAWQRRPHDAWSRQRVAVLRVLRRLGLPSAAHESPLRWAEQVRERFGARGHNMADLLQSLERARYAPGVRRWSLRESLAWRCRLRAAGRMLAAK